MNDHVFAYKGSPLEKLEVEIGPNGITQKGVLRKALKIPFSIVGSVALTPQGEIRVHPTSIRAAGIGVRGLMKTFGIEMDQLMKLKEDRGVRIVGDDFLLSPDRMLPPPQIQGKVTDLKLEPGRMVLTFGSPGQKPGAPLSPPDKTAPNYMYYEGGVLAFGKLTMNGAELQIVDADPSDPFDFFLDHYNEQLVAGYDENLPHKGLLVHMPDYNKLGKASARRDKPPVASPCSALAQSVVAVRAAEEGDGVGGLRVGVALEARPGATLRVPEVALEAVGVVGVDGEHPAEEDVGRSLAGVLEEALAQVHVVASDALGDGSARADALQEVDTRPARRHGAGDVGLGQADGGLDARRRGKAWKKGRLRRIG